MESERSMSSNKKNEQLNIDIDIKFQKISERLLLKHKGSLK